MMAVFNLQLATLKFLVSKKVEVSFLQAVTISSQIL